MKIKAREREKKIMNEANTKHFTNSQKEMK
jgi:hypothetical protein